MFGSCRHPEDEGYRPVRGCKPPPSTLARVRTAVATAIAGPRGAPKSPHPPTPRPKHGLESEYPLSDTQPPALGLGFTLPVAPHRPAPETHSVESGSGGRRGDERSEGPPTSVFSVVAATKAGAAAGAAGMAAARDRTDL